MDTSHNEVREILAAALDDAFAAPQHQTVQPAPSENKPTPSIAAESALDSTAAPSSESSLIDEDTWKEEYEALVRSWHAQSAEQREKAEKERSKWEAIRAREKDEAERRKAAGISDSPAAREGWEKVGVPSATGPATATSSELFGPGTDNPVPSGMERSRREASADELQKWENLPSVASSFPSLSFDTRSASRPAEQSVPQPPVAVTLSIFDPSLSNRTRLLAFASSLAMNLVLPFINGVMLGFGEIFARDVVMGWLGWTTSATSVGLGRNPLVSRNTYK